MAIKTVLTEHLGIEQPVIAAPMALVAGARLAAAVSEAGGLGLIGGGYGDADWLQRDLALAHSPAASIVEGMVAEAQKLLHRAGSLVK
jgi:nitronate monooxygenase